MAAEVLRLALPSKGMEEETLAFLESCGLPVGRSNPRQYRASIAGLPGATVIFQRAPDIFSKVQDGSFDVGITGFDIVSEHRREDDEVLLIHPGLGYGRCALVVAVPEAWIDVETISDLAEVAAELRARGRELRVATKYPNLTRQFLYDHALPYFTLVESHGAMEAAPAMGYADIITDITSSGTTLRENRLKTLADGTILHSEACLVGNRRNLAGCAPKLAVLRVLLEHIEASLRARSFLRLTANIQGESEASVVRRVTAHGEVAGMRGPTVARVYPKAGEAENWFAVMVVVEQKLLLPAVETLRRAGASEVSASPLNYVFDSRCWAYEALERALAERGDGRDGAEETLWR